MLIFIKYLKFFLLGCLLYSCNNSGAIKSVETPPPKIINFIMHAVIPYNYDSCTVMPKLNSKFKILTYINANCGYCWEEIYLWNTIIDELNKYPQVSFFCIVAASPNEFDTLTSTEKLLFPVFLDVDQRFRIVNMIGNEPNISTFLLNEENKVIETGLPKNEKILNRYIKIITK
jgi:hypothetical protein